ncbi:unnamed protein product [Arabis nemorensis]|uniref:Uncharacterized protein n=1 Tax=Arabis nemorensis TaxID=586526 RepID=A0A565CW18_9BRAS|nr:unnamed protein product [Arabis nemorensis]
MLRRFFRKCVERILHLDVSSCGTLTDGFSKLGNMHKASSIFDEMDQEGVTPNVIICNMLIGGYCSRSGAIERAKELSAEKVMENMVRLKYTLLILHFLKRKEWSSIWDFDIEKGFLDEAVFVISSTMKLGLVPDLARFGKRCSSQNRRKFWFGNYSTPRSVFFVGSRTSPFLRMGRRSRSKSTGASRYTVGPVRVVNEKVVGIDLGTTNSAVAAMEGGKPTIVTNAEGQRTTPSVVAYTKSKDRLVGQIAKRQAVVNPENTFFSVKRFIGRRMNEVAQSLSKFPIELLKMRMEMLSLSVLLLVLRKLVDDASRFLNDKVTKAVITVPAYFNDSQRTATKDAGRIAGLEVLRIINEPTSASLAYGFERKSNETILVFDLGGVLEVGDGVFEVLSTSGDTHLGGDDFDKRVVDWLASTFKKDEGIDLLKDKQALQRLTEAAEKAKIELSSLTQTNMSLPFITATADGPKHIETTLTRAKFEELCSDLLDR